MLIGRRPLQRAARFFLDFGWERASSQGRGEFMGRRRPRDPHHAQEDLRTRCRPAGGIYASFSRADLDRLLKEARDAAAPPGVK